MPERCACEVCIPCRGSNFAFLMIKQMMSMRTGMTLPPMVMPPGLQQHMQMPQMAGMPSMGMGMGMVPMGLGMGMMDMAAQGRGVMPMQPHVSPSLNGKMATASSLVDVHGYQQPGVMDYNAYMARQHQPMQMTQVTSESLVYCLPYWFIATFIGHSCCAVLCWCPRLIRCLLRCAGFKYG